MRDGLRLGAIFLFPDNYKKVLDNYAVKIGRCKKKIFLNPQLPQQDFSKNKNAKMRKCENARIQRE